MAVAGTREAIRAFADHPDSFQRAALLVARWSGARRDEIRRLPVDCRDRYPDGSAAPPVLP